MRVQKKRENISDLFLRISFWGVVTLEESDWRLREGYIFPQLIPWLYSWLLYAVQNSLVSSSIIIVPPWICSALCLLHCKGLYSYLFLYLWYPDQSLTEVLNICLLAGWIDRWTGGWMDEWRSRWVGWQMYGWMSGRRAEKMGGDTFFTFNFTFRLNFLKGEDLQSQNFSLSTSSNIKKMFHI